MPSGVTPAVPAAYTAPGGDAMRRCRRGPPAIGWIAVFAGIIVLLALILPSGFWWFALGVALIAAGIWLLRSCG